MLPPIDSTTLSAFPTFDTLYRDLCTNKINPDGSSVLDVKAQKQRDVFATDLRNARLQGAKRNLVTSELRDLYSNQGSLPDELQELVAIAVTTLDGQVPEGDYDLVQEYIDALFDDPSRVAAAVQQNLDRNTTALARIVSPNTKLEPGKTPQALTDLNRSIATHRSDLAAARLDITSDTSKIHDLYKQILSSSIKLLEQTIHGSVSRASRAKAEYLAIVAEGMAKKLGVQYEQLLSQVYSHGLQDMLQERSEQLSRDERNVKRRIDAADEKLQQYRAGRGIEGMANEYAQVMSEAARVREEIARLESQNLF